GFPGILLARVAHGKIARYDIVYDQYIVWKYPMIKLGDSNALKLHQESDSAYWKLRYRENSDSEEFSRIFSAMKAEYGEPDSASSISDKIYLWKRKHIALRSLDNGRTTIVSFFGNLDKPYIESDWQFSSIYLDSTLVKIPLGSDKQELKSIFHFRDTVVDELTPNVTQGTIEQWSWGIPGKLTFTFDSTNKLIHFVWEGVGIGSTYFLRTFVAIDLMLRALLREDIETKKVKEGEVRIRWHSLFYGDILIIYYDPLNFAFYKMEPKLADSYMEN
ncbi:MAG: hypothetical protein Q8919_12420, partial [Bacteroidota bacterium]|nr:hypothetical protein [Bacteroidota bacterium]